MNEDLEWAWKTRFNQVAARTTLYASSNDEALRLSKQYQGYQRAGDVRPQIVITPGVDSIDVSAVDTSLLGHSYYGDNTSVISDIARLLRTGLPPERRCGIQAAGDTLVRYWSFLAKSICPAGVFGRLARSSVETLNIAPAPSASLAVTIGV